MPPSAAPHARLYVLIARHARRAVVFRRGPAKRTLILAWNLADDTLERGQWFKGRIYERRCDLSPDGELLVCEAASNRPPLYSWTAISRPPFLTALALWRGAGMWGGAMFGDDWTTLRMNNLRLREAPLRPTGAPLPDALEVSLLAPVMEERELTSRRLQRDGWRIVSEGTRVRLKRGSPLRGRYDPPAIRERPIGAGGLKLSVQLLAEYETNGPPYVETCQVQDAHGEALIDLGRIDWADLDQTGDLLYAADGCLYRLLQDRIAADPRSATPTKIADLNALTFEEVVAPDWAQRWP